MGNPSHAQTVTCDRVFETVSLKKRIINKAKSIQQAIIEKFVQINEKYNQNPTWMLSKEDEAHLNSFWELTEKTDAEKLEMLYQEITKIRIKTKNKISKQQIESVLKTVNSNTNWYEKTLGKLLEKGAGPHYNPIFNRTSIGGFKNENDQHLDKVMTMIRMHEIEHAVHRNFNPLFFLVSLKIRVTEMLMYFKTPLSPVIISHMERRAIGSQWEMVKRLPKEKIDELINESKAYEDNMINTAKEKIFSNIINNQAHAWFMAKYFEIQMNLSNHSNKDADISQHLSDMIAIFMRNKPKNLKSESDLVLKEATRILTKDELRIFKVMVKFGAENHPESIPHHISEYRIAKETDSEFKELLQSKINSLSLGKILNETQILKLKMNGIFLKSLEHHKLTKEEFIFKMLKHHGYDFKNLYAGHYNFSGFLPTMLFYDMISKMTMISRYPNHEVLFIAHDFQFIYELWFNYFK